MVKKIIILVLILIVCIVLFMVFLFNVQGVADSTNKVKIIFYYHETNGNRKIEYIFNNDNIEELKVLKKVITRNNKPLYKCGYDGEITYYKNEKILLTGEFNLNNGCKHIVVEYKGLFFSKELSDEGLRFLKSYYAGRINTLQ